MSQNETDQRFQFQLAGKDGVTIFIFAGPMNSSGIRELDRCMTVIEALATVKKVIFYFRDVSTVSGDAINYLAKLQAAVRSKKMDLRLCGLNPPIREKLFKMGILRHKETSDNLEQALKMAA